MTGAHDWITAKAAGTIDPPRVATALAALAAHWPATADPLPAVIEHFAMGEEVLLHLLAVSSICAERLAGAPDLLTWLQRLDVSFARRHPAEMLADLHRDSAGNIATANFRALRIWKGREMFRIALREISGAAPLEETTAELSQVAQICVMEVYDFWRAELGARRGTPATPFTILGVGKLGGRELNHSSDIDLIFVYGDEGQLTPNFSYHQWFNLLGAKIAETFAAAEPAGSLFRLDLRLRPEGAAGPLARSLESMENYYSGFGETWERLALTKARRISGSEELAYEFLRQHQSFIYPRSPTPDLLDEVAAIKRRIERDIVGHENLDRNVKLGAGGIREIEFIVQALQLIHGARHAFLQEPSTLKALPALAQLELLPQNEVLLLDSAYRFLRSVEHRLQIEAEQQTHTIPDDAAALRRLALSLGFISARAFLDQLRTTMAGVRTVFRRIISDPATKSPNAPKFEAIFRDEKSAAKALAELERGHGSFHVAPRTRQVFRRLQPLLLERLAQTPDPDGVLNQLIRFVEAYGMRSMLFEMLVANPRLLELLVKIFDASRYAGDLLIRRPPLLEEVTRREMLDRSHSVQDHLQNLETLRADASSLDAVRIYRHTQTLRIMLRDVLGLADLPAVLTENSALAEACIVFVQRLQQSGASLTVIGLGKFGGAEISYGADIDVLFIGDDTRAAQQLMGALAQSTSEGAICALDPRLRPDGDKGSLTTPLAASEKYFATRAQIWEAQALTRARPICGPECDAFLEIAKGIWRRAGDSPDLITQISAMVDRIRRERAAASDELDFKAGSGGMIVAEFIVQALQMRSGIWATTTASAIDELVQKQHLTGADGNDLKSSYRFLRLVESALRRHQNRSVDSLPPDKLGQTQIAKRVGASTLDEFDTRFRRARRQIQDIYSRYLGGTLSR
ncbi:MAG: bifunctional [glutamate--ammonia ligase]-adenylyl-L-tyrosine phosphorylase/[glutamate--ammonia-ligase] adenylyltransferase [Verrucomicrobiota bacterium]|nr:bifunctional [glutamate--ammonia ligase]-adenylyl-L-tyrosine phosphorylase/[glutamate--ammonia-ligase] adenylyltransferase [Verrucomicrobiota bacterium]